MRRIFDSLPAWLLDRRRTGYFVKVERVYMDQRGQFWAEVSYFGKKCYVPVDKTVRVGQKILVLEGLRRSPVVEKRPRGSVPVFVPVFQEGWSKLIRTNFRILHPEIFTVNIQPFELSFEVLSPDLYLVELPLVDFFVDALEPEVATFEFMPVEFAFDLAEPNIHIVLPVQATLFESAYSVLSPIIDILEPIPLCELELTLLAPRIATAYTILGTIAVYLPVKYGRFMEMVFDGEYLYAYDKFGTLFSAMAVSSGTQHICVRTNDGIAVYEIVHDPNYRSYLQDVSFSNLHSLQFEKPNIPHIDIEVSDSFVVLTKYNTATETAIETNIYDFGGQLVSADTATLTILIGKTTDVVSKSGSQKAAWIGGNAVNEAQFLSCVPDSDELGLQTWFDATGTRLFLPKVNTIKVFNLQGEQTDEIIYDIPSEIRGDEMAKIPTVLAFDDQYLVGSLTQNLSYFYAFFADQSLNVGSYDPIICYDYFWGDPEKPAYTILQARPWQKFVLVPK